MEGNTGGERTGGASSDVIPIIHGSPFCSLSLVKEIYSETLGYDEHVNGGLGPKLQKIP
jgi:hypothetical protein